MVWEAQKSIFYQDWKLIHQQILVISFLVFFFILNIGKKSYIYFLYSLLKKPVYFFFFISSKLYTSLFCIVSLNTKLFKNLHRFLSKAFSVRPNILLQPFALFKFMILCPFVIKPCFKSCCNNLMPHLYFFCSKKNMQM